MLSAQGGSSWLTASSMCFFFARATAPAQSWPRVYPAQVKARAAFRAFSAGSHPKGAVNPFAIKVLESLNVSHGRSSLESWDEFAAPDAPVDGFRIHGLRHAAGETCPDWPGQPMTAHWGIEDPAAVEGPEIQKETAFVLAARYLKNRISRVHSLPIRSIDHMALGKKLREIGAARRRDATEPSAAEVA